MNWAKTIRYQTNIKVGRYTYPVKCEQDFDGGYSVYVKGRLVADVDSLPTEEELEEIISDNIKIEGSIKESYLAQGVFDGTIG